MLLIANSNLIATFVTAKHKTVTMARPISADTANKVTLHVNGGYRYASTRPRVVNVATGKNTNKSIHWGTVTEDLRFIPNRRYIYAPLEERSKLVFPEDWDLSEIKKLSANRGPGRPPSGEDDKNRLYGATWLMEQIAERTGIRRDLEDVFDGNKDMVDDIMTLAMFPYMTNLSYSRLSRHQEVYKFPSSRPLTPPDITRLTQSIKERHRMKLLKLRAARVGRDELCAVDSTSRSAYGSSLADIRWGHNKEGMPLEQTDEVVVYTLKQHMPIYYRTFPGNIPDSRTMDVITTDIDHAEFPDVIFITDRGYMSTKVLEDFILKDRRAIMAVKTNQRIPLEKICAFGQFGAKPDGMEFDAENKVYYKQYDIDYEIKTRVGAKKADRLRLNLFFDPATRGEKVMCTEMRLQGQKKALEEIQAAGEPAPDADILRKEYNLLTVEVGKDGKIKSFAPDKEKFGEDILTAGFFAILTLKLDMTAPETMDAYQLRDEQEKYYQQMKSEVASDRQRNWSEDGKTGRLFILFVSLIMTSYLRHIWKTTQLKKLFPSSLDILDEMRSIRCIEHEGHAKKITPFVGNQLEICEAFGFEVPKGCKPGYKSKKVGRKRGRPRKNPEA